LGGGGGRRKLSSAGYLPAIGRIAWQAGGAFVIPTSMVILNLPRDLGLMANRPHDPSVEGLQQRAVHAVVGIDCFSVVARLADLGRPRGAPGQATGISCRRITGRAPRVVLICAWSVRMRTGVSCAFELQESISTCVEGINSR